MPLDINSRGTFLFRDPFSVLLIYNSTRGNIHTQNNGNQTPCYMEKSTCRISRAVQKKESRKTVQKQKPALQSYALRIIQCLSHKYLSMRTDNIFMNKGRYPMLMPILPPLLFSLNVKLYFSPFVADRRGKPQKC